MKIALFAFLLLAPLLQADELADLMKQGAELDAQWKTPEAMAAYKKAEAIAPKNVEVLCKVAKEHIEGMLDVTSKADKIAEGEAGLAYAKKALAIDPESALAHGSMAVSYGRLATLEDNKTKLAYSKLVKEHAEKARDLNPSEDIPYFVLGCWNLEVAGLNPVLRAVARVIYGEMPSATNEDAIKEFKEALERNPRRVGTWFHLGRAYAELQQDDAARTAFNKALSLPKGEKDDDTLKAKARELLAKLN